MARANFARPFAVVFLVGIAAPFFVPNLAIATDAETPAQGVFERTCAGCHSEARVLRRVKAVAAVERQKKLEAFMTDHHAPDPSERELLVRYLMTKAAR